MQSVVHVLLAWLLLLDFPCQFFAGYVFQLLLSFLIFTCLNSTELSLKSFRHIILTSSQLSESHSYTMTIVVLARDKMMTRRARVNGWNRTSVVNRIVLIMYILTQLLIDGACAWTLYTRMSPDQVLFSHCTLCISFIKFTCMWL